MITLGDPIATGKTKPVVWGIAEEFARSKGFSPGDRIEPLIERLGGRLVYLHSGDSIEAEDGSLLVYAPGDFEIMVSAFTGPERDRFTIAHELGHYVLHSDLGKRPIRAARFESNRVEWEANWFAAAFLMPEDDFRLACSRYQKDQPSVAARYMVSPKAVAVRMESLGLT